MNDYLGQLIVSLNSQWISLSSSLMGLRLLTFVPYWISETFWLNRVSIYSEYAREKDLYLEVGWNLVFVLLLSEQRVAGCSFPEPTWWRSFPEA